MSRAYASATPLKRAVQLKGRFYGHIDPKDIPIFSTFENRYELVQCGVHGMMQAGIYGDPEEGAFSICISGGYEDDKDEGDRILYVGSGGQNKETGVQEADQSFEDPPNKSLLVSCHTRLPVRVIRGTARTFRGRKDKGDINHYAPYEGYRYDGLYLVDSAKMEKGKQGYQMCFFELSRVQVQGVGPIPQSWD